VPSGSGAIRVPLTRLHGRLASQREDSPEGTGTFGREKGDIQIYVVRRERIEGVDRSVAKLGDYESAELVQVRMFH
jgi:hypothetical protein